MNTYVGEIVVFLNDKSELYGIVNNMDAQLGDGESKPDIEGEYNYDNIPFSYELKYVMGGEAALPKK